MAGEVFIFIGPRKTGTTSLYESLREFYPWLSKVKESFYLSDSKDASKELARIDRQISEHGLAIIVEPSYFCSELAYDFVAAQRDKYKIILIHSKRDALKRSISHYLHHKGKGRCFDLADCIDRFPEVINESNYRWYKSRWLALDCKFVEIEVGSSTAVSVLRELGLKINGIGITNVRYSPRFPGLTRFLVLIRESWVGNIFARIIPSKMLGMAKQAIFYGGSEVSVTKQERQQLERRLSKLDGEKT